MKIIGNNNFPESILIKLWNELFDQGVKSEMKWGILKQVVKEENEIINKMFIGDYIKEMHPKTRFKLYKRLMKLKK